MSGFILYRGPSLLDGSPVVAIVTLDTSNRKTGYMPQSWILRTDMAPLEARRTGADVAVCGDCRHRGRSCYVNVAYPPQAVYHAFQRGAYAALTIGEAQIAISGRKLRIGSYGDPAAVPGELWVKLAQFSAGHTGYTHQWRREIAAELRGWLMASVDSMDEAEAARAAGWRYYRVQPQGRTLKGEHEQVCPASKEAGRKINCEFCLRCNGSSQRADIVTQIHGTHAARFVY